MTAAGTGGSPGGPPGYVPDPITLVYIAGAHRSGATALGAVLGSLPPVFFAGELYRIPQPIFGAPHPARGCSCGVPADGCPFWGQVRARIGREPGMLPALRRGQVRFERWRWLGRTLWKQARRDPGFRDHAARMGRLVRILAETSGRNIVVESSFNPLRGRIYRDPAAGLRVRVIHLVRDGRSFVSSEKGATDPPEFAWKWIRTTPVIIGRWVTSHLLSIALLRRRGSYLRLRYEDLIESPETALRRISEFVGVDLTAVAGQIQSGRPFPMMHIVAGNHLRLQGPVLFSRELPAAPRLDLPDRVLFWSLGGWLALLLGYRPQRRSGRERSSLEVST